MLCLEDKCARTRQKTTLRIKSCIYIGIVISITYNITGTKRNCFEPLFTSKIITVNYSL